MSLPFVQKSFFILCDNRFANNELEQDNWTQMEELPLSEGFHWESIPDSPSFAPFTGLPPPVQNTPRSQLPTEPQFSPLMPEASKELPKQDDNGRQTVTVKVESNSEEKNGSVTDQSTAKNRTNTVMTVSKRHPIDSGSLRTFNNFVFSTTPSGF